MMIVKPDAAAAEAPASSGRTSDVRGVIDNLTPDRLYGWAWDHGHPEHRVRIALRIAGETVAEGVADGARGDLAKAGIGDGRHAFELPIGAAARERLQEASVIAFGLDGREFQIAARLPRREEPPSGNALARMLDGVIAEQREMKRELVALRDQAGGLPGAEAVDAAARVGEELGARMAHLELWLSRLDAQLAELVTEQKPAADRGIDPWQAVLYALLASLSAAALAAAALRWLA